MKSIYDYNNHLEFLKDRCKFLKIHSKNFSHRYIASKLGFKSSAIFLHIINKKIKISESLLKKIAKLFKLPKIEAKYLKILTRLNQSTSKTDKIDSLNNLIKFINLHLKSSLFYHYNSLIKKYKRLLIELSPYINTNPKYKELSFFLNRYIKGIGRRKGNLALLRKFDIIEYDKNGFITPVNQIITNGAYKEIKEIKKYYLDSLEIIKNLVYADSYDRKEVSSVLFSISEKTFKRIQDEIVELYKKIIFLAEKESYPESIYVLNLNAFPILSLLPQNYYKKKKDANK